MPFVALVLAATPPASALPSCTASQLSLAVDGQGGAFNGMSHGGALLVIRNLGPKACRLPGLPMLVFKDAKGRPLPIARQAPKGMHPGPVVVPVGVAAGAELTVPLRWVSGEVYDRSQCLTTAFAAVTIGAEMVQTAFTARLCGQAGVGIGFDQPILHVDPVL